MNETIKTILERRSIRTFKQEQITDEELLQIIEAGKYAPSAANQQSWHFTVIQNKDVLARVNKVGKAVFAASDNKMFQERAKAENFSIYFNAPTLMIVTGDPKGFAPQCDCSLALGNMMLAAASLGIGSCWVHAFGMLQSADEFKALLKELGVPEGNVVVGSAVFGYNSGSVPSAAPRKEGTVDIIK